MTTPKTLEIGTMLGEFQIERILGKGGMGIVYKAHEPSLNRKVALKVLSQMLSNDEEFITRFKKEAQIIAALNHPNIVSILTFGNDLGHYYFAMEYIKGTDLGQVLKERTVIPLDEALRITRQVAEALSEAGGRGVVHRDLKPANIMIDDMNRIRVTDFGVARIEESTDNLTKTGMFLGTPEYASPEQASGDKVDTRSDIYALGALLYRMLSGKPPITGDSPLAVVVKIASEPVTPIGLVNPSVPKPVTDLIDKMMARGLLDRFQTPQEVLQALDTCEAELKKSGANLPADKKSMDNSKKEAPQFLSNRMVWAGAALVGVAIVLALIFAKGGVFAPQTSTDTQLSQMDSGGVEGDTRQQKKIPDGQGSAEQFLNKQTTHSGQKITPQKDMVMATSLPAIHSSESVAVLPEKPTVLLMVSGADDMSMFLRSHIESAMLDSDLQVISPAEIPMLREKMQLGKMPISWYDIKQFVPSGNAQILIMAKMQKSGSTTLQYFGSSREQITANFSVRTMDMATGATVERTVTGMVQYTDLNMEEKFADTVGAEVSHLGGVIQEYWQTKINGPEKTADESVEQQSF